MSLSSNLKNHIRSKSTVNLSELHQIAEEQGHKQSYCERQLRLLSEKDFIEPIKNDKGYITGYRWIDFTVFENAYTPEYIEKKKHEYHNPKLI